MTAVFSYLCQHGSVIGADAFDRRDAVAELIELWRAEQIAR